VFSCRQEVNLKGVCLNGTHPCLLADFKPFPIVNVKLAVWIVCGQWVESTRRPGLFWEGNTAEISRFHKPAGLVSEISSLRCADQNSSRYGQTLLTYVRKQIDNL
jgi:hypothetical protein